MKVKHTVYQFLLADFLLDAFLPVSAGPLSALCPLMARPTALLRPCVACTAHAVHMSSVTHMPMYCLQGTVMTADQTCDLKPATTVAFPDQSEQPEAIQENASGAAS